MKKLLAGALLASVLTACASSPPPAEPVAPTEPPKLSARLDLAEYLPAPGLRWLVSLKPQELSANTQLQSDWESVFSGDRLQEFRAGTGFDASQVKELWIAGYALGTLYLFDAAQVGEQAEAAFRARALTTAEVPTRKDDLVHVTGMMNQTPHSLIHLQGHLVAIAEGDITLTKIVAARAEERLSKFPSALQTRFLKPFAQFEGDAPLRAFLIGPFPEATDAVAGAFVSGAMSLELHKERLSVKARALGLWPNDPARETQMSHWVSDVLQSRELRALGWGFPLSLSPVQCEASSLEVEMSECTSAGSWNSRQVAEAIHRVTAGDMQELAPENAPPGWTPQTDDKGFD